MTITTPMDTRQAAVEHYNEMLVNYLSGHAPGDRQKVWLRNTEDLDNWLPVLCSVGSDYTVLYVTEPMVHKMVSAKTAMWDDYARAQWPELNALGKRVYHSVIRFPPDMAWRYFSQNVSTVCGIPFVVTDELPEGAVAALGDPGTEALVFGFDAEGVELCGGTFFEPA